MDRQLSEVPGANDALALIEEAYGTRVRRAGRTARHPIAVAELLLADGRPTPVILAGLLHDVLEDTEVGVDELDRRFGPEIARLVEASTQDESIREYASRKAALRLQILDGSPDAATVTLADKLEKLLGRDRRPAKRKLEHYRQTLEGVEARYGCSGLSRRLREELSRWPPGSRP